MLLRQTLKQTLAQKIDPKIILANNILACSSLELTQAIEQELAENPALERPEDDICGNCTLPPELCAHCPLKPQTNQLEEEEIDWREFYSPEILESSAESFAAAAEDSDYDPLANVYTQCTLQDHLTDLLRAEVTGRKFQIGEYIIGSINARGYFDGNIQELAEDLKVSVEEVEEILRLIQGFDPPGIGATTLQQCLAIQLENLENRDALSALALRMVRDHWSDTSAQRVARLSHSLKVPRKYILQALKFIREHTNPHPGEAFRPPWDTSSGSLEAVQPDIIVRRTVAGYEIDVLMSDHQMLAINNKYREAYRNMRNGHSHKFSEEEKRHVTEYVDRAEAFVRSIQQRRKTLKAITKYVVEFQQGYVETGQKSFLRPLTRTQVARAIGMHESTVSRATANKWIQLPSEEVVSFDRFFDGSISVKDLIDEIIASENKEHPLSDQEISEKLAERGYAVARRTVVKYREAQNILSSRRRKAS